MKQLTLWDFIPEPEDGKLCHEFLYFSKESYWMHSIYYDIPEIKQIDIFDLLNYPEEEIFMLTNLAYTTEEEDRKFLKYMNSHDRHYVYFKHGWRLPLYEINIAENWFFKKWTSHEKKKEPQNSFFCHESVFLKGLKEMFKRKRRS